MKRWLFWGLGSLALLVVAGLIFRSFLGSEIRYRGAPEDVASAPLASNGERQGDSENGGETALPRPPPMPMPRPDPVPDEDTASPLQVILPERYQVSIEAPKRMVLDTERDLRVKVFIEGEGFAPDDLSSVTEGAMEAVSRELSAEVSGGSAFEIRPPAEVRQRLVGNEIDWVFGIKAVETGEHRLIVSIAQWRESVPTVLTEKTWVIEVRVDPVNALLTYLARHLPETIGAGIVLLVGTLFAVWAARMRKKAGLQPNSDDTDG